METIFSGDSKAAKKGRKWLAGMLEQSVVEVTFTKKDGTERVMNCTLLEDYLPETTGAGRSSAGSDALAVFDVDADGWRSFRWDSIKTVKLSVESANA
jgi:hypothetical protein